MTTHRPPPPPLTIYPHPFPQCLCEPPRCRREGDEVIANPILRHGLFPWQSAVVEGVHVDDLLRFHHDRRLRLVFEAALALEGNPQLVHYRTAKGPLQKEIEGEKSRTEWVSDRFTSPNIMGK